jgi:hypothetical protein
MYGKIAISGQRTPLFTWTASFILPSKLAARYSKNAALRPGKCCVNKIIMRVLAHRIHLRWHCRARASLVVSWYWRNFVQKDRLQMRRRHLEGSILRSSRDIVPPLPDCEVFVRAGRSGSGGRKSQHSRERFATISVESLTG